ncbi:hypothetical protein C8J57DRAFT_1220809 [Mycena rebaudengoi]|nr:hypothetical protein C8J57DRAFT_1220809 [Mycena rebaudengoi]
MPYGISIVCAIAGHPHIRETVSFAPDYSYSGQRLIASLQKAHDAQCACATRIHKAWKVQAKYADVEAMFNSLPEDDEYDAGIQLVSPGDIMLQCFPSQPPKDIGRNPRSIRCGPRRHATILRELKE